MVFKENETVIDSQEDLERVLRNLKQQLQSLVETNKVIIRK